MEKLLMDYKYLKIDYSKLKESLGDNPFHFTTPSPIQVTSDDVLFALVSCQYGKISEKELVQWADVIRLSNLYEYSDNVKEQEKIASVIDRIQDIQVFNKPISNDELEKLIALIQNK